MSFVCSLEIKSRAETGQVGLRSLLPFALGVALTCAMVASAPDPRVFRGGAHTEAVQLPRHPEVLRRGVPARPSPEGQDRGDGGVAELNESKCSGEFHAGQEPSGH